MGHTARGCGLPSVSRDRRAISPFWSYRPVDAQAAEFRSNSGDKNNSGYHFGSGLRLARMKHKIQSQCQPSLEKGGSNCRGQFGEGSGWDAGRDPHPPSLCWSYGGQARSADLSAEARSAKADRPPLFKGRFQEAADSEFDCFGYRRTTRC